jgi:hypothetical protein
MQQSKDSEGNLTNDGYWSRIVSPIYNLYAHDLEVVVAKSDTFDTDGAFFFSLHYVYDWANIRNQSATYKAIFSGHAKLDNSFAKNFAHTNNNLWNWGISSTDVKLSWETVSGDGATLKETAFGNSNAAWCWENDASGDNNPDSDNPRLPSVINTDPYLDNWIVRTPQVFIYWVINGQKDDNNKR